KRTVLPAFTLIDSPVRGLSPLRAFVFLTVNVPKLGSVNLPLFFSSLTMASIRSPAARLAAAPVSSTDSLRTWERNAFDMEDFLVMERCEDALQARGASSLPRQPDIARDQRDVGRFAAPCK